MASTAQGARAIQRLLVAIDVSDGTDRALKPALQIAQRAGVAVVLFSWSPDEAGSPALKEHLEGLAGDLPGVTVDVAVTADRTAAPSIVAAAGREEATVCMAAHGRSGLARALLGSVTEQALGLLGEPCLLVGPGVTEPPHLWHTGVLVCVDGSPWSEAAVPVAHRWAEQLALPLTLVHVREPDASFGGVAGVEQMEHAYLSSLAARVDPQAPPRTQLLYGDPARAISTVAQANADLVVMATHGRTGLARTVLGSVAMRVVHQSPRPVLVVPTGPGR